MGDLMSKPKTVEEIIKENQKMIRKAVRELEREISKMEKDQTKLTKDIKKMAKANQTATVKIMVKDLVRMRNYVNRFIMMKTQLSAVGLKIQTMKSQESMTRAMKGVTKALVTMNKQMSLPQLTKIMQEFMSENERSELQDEMMNDVLDEAMTEGTYICLYSILM
jgi:charged multivesicular body protein 2A